MVKRNKEMLQYLLQMKGTATFLRVRRASCQIREEGPERGDFSSVNIYQMPLLVSASTLRAPR